MRGRRLGDDVQGDVGTLGGKLSYVRLDHLENRDAALLVLGPSNGTQRVHVLTEHEAWTRLVDVGEDELERVWELGRSVHSLPRLKPSAQNTARNTGGTPPPPTFNPQTLAEAQAASNGELVGKVTQFLAQAKDGECPKEWKPFSEVITWPVFDAAGQLRQLPYIVLAHTCAGGNYSVVKTVIPVNDPLAPKDSTRISICSTKIERQVQRKFVLEQSTKVTQIGFGFSLGFNPVFPPLQPVLSSPKPGDAIHENGQEKKDPATGQTMPFNLNFMQMHSQLRFEAWQSFFLKAGELDCRQV